MRETFCLLIKLKNKMLATEEDRFIMQRFELV